MEDLICEVCKVGIRERKLTNETFNINGKYIIVENIPVEICNHCGEETYLNETTEQLRKIAQGEIISPQQIEAPLYYFKKVS